MKKIISLLFLISVFSATLFANEPAAPETIPDRSSGLIRSSLKGLEYRLKAGLNVGGTSPLPLPNEIRKLNKYDPTLQIAIEGDVVKWFTPRWGLLVGARLENKGMRTDANVKNYGMKMIAEDGGKMEGYWTGNVVTEVQNSYLSIPVAALWKPSPRWELKGGAFFSYVTKGHFSGHVYEGYLREGDPTGTKVEFEGNSIATYDFSSELRKFQWGAELGAQWRAYKHLSIYADLTWGLMDIFKSDFRTISFDMYPIYMNFGFAYIF